MLDVYVRYIMERLESRAGRPRSVLGLKTYLTYLRTLLSHLHSSLVCTYLYTQRPNLVMVVLWADRGAIFRLSLLGRFPSPLSSFGKDYIQLNGPLDLGLVLLEFSDVFGAG